MSDDTHRALLQAVAARDAGSEGAMAALYQALNGAVFAFVRRHLYAADDHAVQDVVVETLYEVWRAAARFGGGSRVLTWVLGIARHKLLDAARRVPPQAHDDIEDHAQTLADPGPDITTRLAEQQRAEWLEWCLDRLPAEQREGLHLLLVEGLSVDAIAQLQGCPGGTVKTRVFHAKAKLKACLARWMLSELPPAQAASPAVA